MNRKYISVNKLKVAIANQTILHTADFAMAAGECAAIVGANGSGKTTLIKAICGLIKPTSGNINIAGLDINSSSQALKAKALIGYAPDHPPLYIHDTVYSYLKFMARLRKVSPSHIYGRIEESLELFDLKQFSNSRIATLSKGTQQRINLAQATLHQPKILILDEPTNALDPQQCENFCNYIKGLRQQEVTVLIVSHHYTDLVPLCDYLLRITNGGLHKILMPLTTPEKIPTHDQINYPA